MIITHEIERLRKKHPNLEISLSVLERLLKKHPELDRADELLETVKELMSEVSRPVGWEPCGMYSKCPGCGMCKGKALIEKIKGRKDGV